MLALTGSLYRAGYHVVGLPSPTFPNFIIDASTTHVPGHLPDDAADLYRVMEQIWARTRGRIEVSEFLLAGYSLGGTEAAFVMKLDEERKAFGFRRAMLLNPAISLYSSVSRIEGLLDRIPGGPRRIGAFHNRVMEKVNDFYRKGDFVAVDDDFLFAGYNAHLLTVVPGFARTGVSNFFSNLREIRTFYNCVLQAKGKKSMVTLGRFLTNSTIGIGGLFDPATALGMRREVEEFDRTLETWGVGTGPYLVLPILGPNTARSASGFAVDAGVRWATMSAVDPFGGTGARTAIEEGVTGLETVDLRHRETFRYYDSNYPFEYYMVRYLFSQERELKILR